VSEPQAEPAKPYDTIKTPDQQDHVHMWEILDVWRPATEAYHPRIPQSQVTIVLIKCRTCELPQTVELQGVWSLGQVLKGYAQSQRKEKGNVL
jgi:hypothetical protein